MPNLLENPASWSQAVGAADAWNGSAWAYAADGVHGFELTRITTPLQAGDTYSGEVSTAYAGDAFLNQISSGGAVINSLALSSRPQYFSYDAFATGPGGRFILSDSAVGTTPTVVNPALISNFTLLLTPEDATSYNCVCDDDGVIVSDTLANLRRRLYVRLGYAAMPTYPPGMAETLDDFLRSAQVMLYNRYAAVRLRRLFTWRLQQGVRFYDLAANRDLCALKLDARRIEWAGVSDGDSTWTPITCGINPASYGDNIAGIVCAYEVRQCIEVWPPPSDNTWFLRIKGDVGLLPMVEDTDRCSIDAEPLFLLALANAKAHYRHDDAGNYSSQAQTMMRDLTAASHGTRRYIPGTQPLANQTMPKRV
jgi:hypothetical protein